MATEKFIVKSELGKHLQEVLKDIPSEYLLVDIASQTLAHIKNGKMHKKYAVSTSKFGIGNQEGSFKTPLGIHRIREKIGHGAPEGRIFLGREDTGGNWQKQDDEENMILTRILRLEGLEEGVNMGGDIDSYERYIYIHGTNREDKIGTPTSHGCVCMKNRDVIDLFDQAEEGTIVIIS